METFITSLMLKLVSQPVRYRCAIHLENLHTHPNTFAALTKAFYEVQRTVQRPLVRIQGKPEEFFSYSPCNLATSWFTISLKKEPIPSREALSQAIGDYIRKIFPHPPYIHGSPREIFDFRTPRTMGKWWVFEGIQFKVDPISDNTYLLHLNVSHLFLTQASAQELLEKDALAPATKLLHLRTGRKAEIVRVAKSMAWVIRSRGKVSKLVNPGEWFPTYRLSDVLAQEREEKVSKSIHHISQKKISQILDVINHFTAEIRPPPFLEIIGSPPLAVSTIPNANVFRLSPPTLVFKENTKFHKSAGGLFKYGPYRPALPFDIAFFYHMDMDKELLKSAARLLVQKLRTPAFGNEFTNRKVYAYHLNEKDTALPRQVLRSRPLVAILFLDPRAEHDPNYYPHHLLEGGVKGKIFWFKVQLGPMDEYKAANLAVRIMARLGSIPWLIEDAHFQGVGEAGLYEDPTRQKLFLTLWTSKGIKLAVKWVKTPGRLIAKDSLKQLSQYWAEVNSRLSKKLQWTVHVELSLAIYWEKLASLCQSLNIPIQGAVGVSRHGVPRLGQGDLTQPREIQKGHVILFGDEKALLITTDQNAHIHSPKPIKLVKLQGPLPLNKLAEHVYRFTYPYQGNLYFNSAMPVTLGGRH